MTQHKESPADEELQETRAPKSGLKTLEEERQPASSILIRIISWAKSDVTKHLSTRAQ